MTPDSKLIVTVSPEKLERVLQIGADFLINYKETSDFTEVVKEYTNKKGVDLILDHIGAKYLAPNMKRYYNPFISSASPAASAKNLNLALMMAQKRLCKSS